MPPQIPPDLLPRAFISYSRKDTPFVERLEAELNQRGILTWRDATSIPGGEDWYKNIVAGLAGAYAVLCIVSANANESKWVCREQLRADEDGIPPIAIHPAPYRNPLHLQEVQPILMDDANFASGMVRVIAALERCKAKTRTPASVSVVPVAETPNDDAAIQEYLKWVLSDAKADLRDALYVDLSAAPERAPQARSKSPMAFGLDDDFMFSSIQMEQLAHDDFARPGDDVPDARQAIHEMRRAVLLGDPGAGKTTTLLKITVDLARAAQTDPNAQLPVYIPLREFDGALPIADFIRSKTHNLQAAFERLHDRFVLLCDALNEMPRQAEDGRDLVAEVRATLRDKPTWVVSCRVRDYTDDLNGIDGIDGIGKIRLKPLDLPRIDEFIRRKYVGWGQTERGAALWRDLGGSDNLLKAWEAFVAHKTPDSFWGKEWLPKNSYPSNDLRSAWRAMHADHRRLMLLCRSPFMANMVCALYRHSEKLPDNRAGLFRDFVVNLLRAEEKRLTDIGLKWIGDVPIRAGMGQVAWAMGALTEMPRADAEAILRQHLSGHDPAKVLSAAASAQLIDYGVNVRFTHQLLQQYFAASVLGALMDNKADPAAIWQPATWWKSTGREETAILLAGDRNDPHGVARWIAPAQPQLALELLSQPDFALDLDKLDDTARSALVAGSQMKADTIDPRGRAAVYRVLGKFNADRRPGVGLRPDGLPDIDWVTIPAGEFTYQEGKMTLDYDFQIARYPVTYAQFQTFIDDREGYQKRGRWFKGLLLLDAKKMYEQSFKYSNHPRDRVNWYQALAFCRWFSWRLDALTPNLSPSGRGTYDPMKPATWAVRLLTEFEWEKAARANTGWQYPYGNEFDAGKVNTYETDIRQTSAVGIFPAGDATHWNKPIADLSGNVWEWCLTDYNNPQIKVVDENISYYLRRVLRGGSWVNISDDARAVYRRGNGPSGRYYNLGFRLCRPLSL